jgi:hypothetical protein
MEGIRLSKTSGREPPAMTKPYGTTIFCDDIRDEVTGKKTYVGVYLDEMVLHGPYPAIIPQFAIAITYLEPLSEPVKPVSIKVFVPGPSDLGDVAVDIELPESRANSIDEAARDPLAEYRAHILHFKISPFVVANEGYVKVRAYIGDQECRLGAMKIRQVTDEEIALYPAQ